MKRLSPVRLFAISVYWFALNLHWGALLTIVLPAQVAVMHPQQQALTLSLLLGLGAVLALFVTPLAGALSDRNRSRFGRRRPFIALGTGIDCLGLVLMAQAHQNLGLYLTGYLVVQLGANIAAGAYAGFIPDLVNPLQRGEASGWMAAMTQIGTIGGALAAGHLFSAHRPWLCYGPIIGVMLAVMLATVFSVEETPISHSEPLRLAAMWVDPRQHPNFAWVWLTRFCAIFGIWMAQPFLLYYMRDVVGSADPPAQLSTLMAVILCAATVTGLLAGAYSDRAGQAGVGGALGVRKRVVYVSNGMLAAAMLTFLFSHSLGFTLAVGALFGAGYGAWYSVDWALACDVLPDNENAGRWLGVWNVAMVLPQTAAPLVAGLLLDLHGMTDGHYPRASYALVFATAAVIMIVAAFLLRNVRAATRPDPAAP